jgi:hypothetical protein
VVARARTHREAITAALSTKPGLVLADIRLADNSSGLDAVNELIGSVPTTVIFITAYPEAPADRQASGADLPHHQALHPQHRKSDRQSGAVLRSCRGRAAAACDGAARAS